MLGRQWGTVTESDVPALAAAILDRQRRRPIVVVTTPNYTDPEHIPQLTLDEADELRSAVGDIADIAVVATGAISFALEDELPPSWHVFNGMCRSYPAGILSDPDIRRSRLRRRRNSEVASERVINDALGHAQAAGLFDVKPKGSATVTATVQGFLSEGNLALVDTGATMPAAVRSDMISPGIPLDWLIAKGASVPGEFDRDHNRFILRRLPFGAMEFLSEYPHGTITLALVDKVSSDTATLRVHPNFAITVHLSDVTSNPLDSLDLFFVEGEVVQVRVIHLSTGKPHLRLSDVDGDEPVIPAMEVVEGGTSWLVEGRTLPGPADPPAIEPPPAPVKVGGPAESRKPVEVTAPKMTTTARPRPMPGPGLRPTTPTAHSKARIPSGKETSAVQSMSMTISEQGARIAQLKREVIVLNSLRQELDGMRRALRDTHSELAEARDTIAHLKNLRARAVNELRSSRKAQAEIVRGRGPRERSDSWPDDEMWIRDEIHRAWSERVSREDKLRHPLPEDYIVGSLFAKSIHALDDAQIDKALKCVVDVLTNRAKDLAGRDLHRLRTGEGGSDAPRVRAADRAVAWRAAIEINSASARRLHYWVIGDRIELSRVGVHDDMVA